MKHLKKGFEGMKDMSTFILSMIASAIVVTFLVMTFFIADNQKDEIVATSIVQDIEQLHSIFERIHETCVIISFDYQKNPINFLNVKSFTSSEVGPMNLVHPEKWEGPYVQDNLAIESIEYQVVRTKNGYFIVPGEGVELPNGKVIGKDLIFDESADIMKMMGDPESLRYQDKSFAVLLDIHKNMDKRIAAAVSSL